MKLSFPATLGALVLASALVQPANAVEDANVGFKTTRDLYAVCSVAPGEPEYLPASFACRGFLEGAVQYHDAVSDRKKLKRLICYPKGATIADGRRAFNVWAEKRLGDKKKMGEIAVVGLVRALADKYPCQ